MNATTAALADGVQRRDGGAFQAGGARRAPDVRPSAEGTQATPVVIVREPAGAWACDSCRTKGSGWIDLDSHFRRTGHRVFTETAPPAGVQR